jgi:hypothetical protein
MARDEKAKVLHSCYFELIKLVISLKGKKNFYFLVLLILSFSLLGVIWYIDSVMTLTFTFGLQMLQQPSRNMQQERRVFTDFFCHPGRLENQVRELSSRIRAIPE